MAVSALMHAARRAYPHADSCMMALGWQVCGSLGIVVFMLALLSCRSHAVARIFAPGAFALVRPCPRQNGNMAARHR